MSRVLAGTMRVLMEGLNIVILLGRHFFNFIIAEITLRKMNEIRPKLLSWNFDVFLLTFEGHLWSCRSLYFLVSISEHSQKTIAPAYSLLWHVYSGDCKLYGSAQSLRPSPIPSCLQCSFLGCVSCMSKQEVQSLRVMMLRASPPSHHNVCTASCYFVPPI